MHAYDHQDPVGGGSYGIGAAAALGVPPGQVFKTLIATVDGSMTVAVVPVAGQLNLKALAQAVGGKRSEMAEPAAAERATGYVTGGSPRSGSASGCPWSSTRRRSTGPRSTAVRGSAGCSCS